MHNDNRVNEFLESGFANALALALSGACEQEGQERFSYFAERVLNQRIKGYMRWGYVDQALFDLAPRFGFEVSRVRVGVAGYPEMVMIKKGSLFVSAHHIRGRSPIRAPRYARYRAAMMPPAQNRLLRTAEEEQQQQLWAAQTDATEFWTVTFQQSSRGALSWMTLGRPAQGQRDLFYHQDLYKLVGYTQQAHEPIILNPPVGIPAFDLTLPGVSTIKTEGQGEK